MNEADTFSDFLNAENNESLHALYDTTGRFALERIAPFANAWDEQGSFPRELHWQAAALGLLGLGYPEAVGGTPATLTRHWPGATNVSPLGRRSSPARQCSTN